MGIFPAPRTSVRFFLHRRHYPKHRQVHGIEHHEKMPWPESLQIFPNGRAHHQREQRYYHPGHRLTDIIDIHQQHHDGPQRTINQPFRRMLFAAQQPAGGEHAYPRHAVTAG